MLTKAAQAPDIHLFLHGSIQNIQLWAAAWDGWTEGSTGNSTASRMQPEAVSFRAKLQHLLLPSPFHNWRIMFSPFTETLRCKSTDARPWIEATYFLLTTLQISSFLAVRTSPDARKACPDMWLLLPWQLLDVQQTVNSLFFQAPEWNQNFPWSWGMQTEQRLSRTAACSEPQSFRALKQHRSIANNRDVLPSQTANSRIKLPMTTFAPVKYDTKQSYSFSAIYTLAFTAMKYQLAY